MNPQQQSHWPSSTVRLLLNVTEAPMGRHIAHPLTGQPLCAAPGTCEGGVDVPVGQFDPAAWLGCKECERALNWLIGEQVSPDLAALRQLLDDPTFGPQPLLAALRQHDGSLTMQALPLLSEHAPVSLWQADLQLCARGEHGVLIEAGIAGHLFPFDEIVVLVLCDDEGRTLHLQALPVQAAVEQVQAAGARLACILTRNRGPYWERALFHLQRA